MNEETRDKRFNIQGRKKSLRLNRWWMDDKDDKNNDKRQEVGESQKRREIDMEGKPKEQQIRRALGKKICRTLTRVRSLRITQTDELFKIVD